MVTIPSNSLISGSKSSSKLTLSSASTRVKVLGMNLSMARLRHFSSSRSVVVEPSFPSNIARPPSISSRRRCLIRHDVNDLREIATDDADVHREGTLPAVIRAKERDGRDSISTAGGRIAGDQNLFKAVIRAKPPLPGAQETILDDRSRAREISTLPQYHPAGEQSDELGRDGGKPAVAPRRGLSFQCDRLHDAASPAQKVTGVGRASSQVGSKCEIAPVVDDDVRTGSKARIKTAVR